MGEPDHVKLADLKPGEIAWHPIRVEAVVFTNHEIWVAPAGTAYPTSYPPSLEWARVGS